MSAGFALVLRSPAATDVAANLLAGAIGANMPLVNYDGGYMHHPSLIQYPNFNFSPFLTMKCFYFFCLLILLIGSRPAFSQQFADPTPNPVVADNFSIVLSGTEYDAQNPFPPLAAGSTVTVYFKARLFRAANTVTNGFVDVFSGTSPNSLTIPALTANSHTIIYAGQWVPVYDATTGRPGPYESAAISSANFTISAAQIAGATGFYASYYDTKNGSPTQGAVSRPISIGSPSPPQSPTTPGSTRPLTDFIPCGRAIAICGDQCVAMGGTAAQINGRILADQGYPAQNTFCFLCTPGTEGPDWHDYGVSASAANTTRFAEGTEFEWVQWQYSYNQYDWFDINGATTASYSPGVINQTTYYRRVSTHIRYQFPTNSREGWYTSGTVTIRIPAATPVAVQDPYIACGTGAIDVAIRPAADASSYAWFSADPNVKINDQSTSYFNQYTSTTTLVRVTLPANATQGMSYAINVSAIGLCGSRSAITTFNVVIDCTVPAPPDVSFVTSSAGTTCQPRYDVRIGRSLGATSYSATLHGGLYEGYNMTVTADPSAYYVDVPFQIAGPVTGIYVSVSAMSPQGTSAPFSTAPQDLAGGSCGYRVAPGGSSIDLLYPNPANDQVTFKGDIQEAEAFFYDGQGVCCKVVRLLGRNNESVVDLRGLPAGLYHVRISAKGKVLKATQLIIQH